MTVLIFIFEFNRPLRITSYIYFNRLIKHINIKSWNNQKQNNILVLFFFFIFNNNIFFKYFIENYGFSNIPKPCSNIDKSIIYRIFTIYLKHHIYQMKYLGKH